MQIYGNAGTGYVYGSTPPDLPRTVDETPRPAKQLIPSLIVLQPEEKIQPAPRSLVRNGPFTALPRKPKPKPKKRSQAANWVRTRDIERAAVKAKNDAQRAEVDAKIAEMARQGRFIRHICEELGVSYLRVDRVMKQQGIEKQTPHQNTLMTPRDDWYCVECGHPMRPHTSTEGWPVDARRHAGKGKCVVCYNLTYKRPNRSVKTQDDAIDRDDALS